MYLIILRDFFEELQMASIRIFPLVLVWLVLKIILKVAKTDKKSFYSKFHRWTGIFLAIAILFPWVGYFGTQFSFGEQRYFKSYEYFVSTEPAKWRDFADELPEEVSDVRYYCYQTPIQFGNTVGVNMKFEDSDVAEEFCMERMKFWDAEYGEVERIIYNSDVNGLVYSDVDEEKLRRYLAEVSESPLEEYKVLVYYEGDSGMDYRWVLYGEKTGEVVEIVGEYTD